VVDDVHQVIVAAEVNDCDADVGNLIPITEQTVENTVHAPTQLVADAGYCSKGDLQQAADVSADRVRQSAVGYEASSVPQQPLLLIPTGIAPSGLASEHVIE
jgi:hypothetical protein